MSTPFSRVGDKALDELTIISMTINLEEEHDLRHAIHLLLSDGDIDKADTLREDHHSSLVRMFETFTSESIQKMMSESFPCVSILPPLSPYEHRSAPSDEESEEYEIDEEELEESSYKNAFYDVFTEVFGIMKVIGPLKRELKDLFNDFSRVMNSVGEGIERIRHDESPLSIVNNSIPHILKTRVIFIDEEVRNHRFSKNDAIEELNVFAAQYADYVKSSLNHLRKEVLDGDTMQYLRDIESNTLHVNVACCECIAIDLHMFITELYEVIDSYTDHQESASIVSSRFDNMMEIYEASSRRIDKIITSMLSRINSNDVISRRMQFHTSEIQEIKETLNDRRICGYDRDTLIIESLVHQRLLRSLQTLTL